MKERLLKHQFEIPRLIVLYFHAQKVRGSNIKPQKRNDSPSFSMENYELRYSVSSTNRPLTHSSISGVRPPGVVIKGYLIFCKKKNTYATNHFLMEPANSEDFGP